jgi:hypothetical protein
VSAQTYRHPRAIERMRLGLCPECGGSPESHTDDVRFWIPRSHGCSLLPHGVTERIQWQRQLDQGVCTCTPLVSCDRCEQEASQ